MKNEILKFGLLYLFIGLIISSCSTSHKMTSCPDFKTKNKKGTFAFAKKVKKKNKKSSLKMLSSFSQTEKASEQASAINREIVTLNQRKGSLIGLSEDNSKLSTDLLKGYTINSIITENSLDENILNNETASIENIMEMPAFAKLKSLGIDHIKYDKNSPTLSKKEMKAIKKEAKKELRKKLQEESGSDAKLAAIIAYLGLIGFLIAYLAIHKKGNEFSAFHLRQSLGINLLYLIPFVGVVSITGIGFAISSVISVAIFVMWLIGLIGAAKGETKPVFLLGNFFQKLFKGIE